jgi:hypothetical protein
VTSDLATQLAEYGRYLLAEQRPIAFSEVVLDEASLESDDVRRLGRRVPHRPRRGAVLVAAAAVSMVLVGAVVWLSRSDTELRIDEPTTTTPATTRPATTAPPTTAPTTTAPPTTMPSTTTPTEPPTELTLPAITTVSLREADIAPADEPFQLLAREVTPSAIGNLHWTILGSDAEDAELVSVVKTPVGYAALDSEGRILVSDDAAAWHALPSPFPGTLQSLTHAEDGRYWVEVATDLGLTQRWESNDLVTWKLADDTAVILADLISEPLAVDLEVGNRLPSGAIFTTGWFNLGSDWIANEVAGDEMARQLAEGLVLGGTNWIPEPSALAGVARIGIYEPGQESQRGPHDTLADIERRAVSFIEFHAEITGTPDDWLLEIVDPATGQPVTTVAGTIGLPTLADTLDALVGGGFGQHLVLIDGHAEPVEPPQWVDPTATTPQSVAFAETNDGLLAYVRPGDLATPTAIWRTTDGRDWQYIGDASTWPAPGPPFPGSVVEQRNGVLLAVIWNGPANTLSVQTSSDGITWQPTTGLPPALVVGQCCPYMAATEGGWLLAVGDGGIDAVDEMWGSPDGSAWEPIDIDDVFSGHRPQPPDPQSWSGSGGQSVAGDVVIWTRHADGGTRTTWILEVT